MWFDTSLAQFGHFENYAFFGTPCISYWNTLYPPQKCFFDLLRSFAYYLSHHLPNLSDFKILTNFGTPCISHWNTLYPPKSIFLTSWDHLLMIWPFTCPIWPILKNFVILTQNFGNTLYLDLWDTLYGPVMVPMVSPICLGVKKIVYLLSSKVNGYWVIPGFR